MPDTKWFRGEGGGLHEFAVPLPEVFADQVRSGRLVEVPPPTPAVKAGPAAAPVADAVADPDETDAAPLDSVERPARADSKADWIAYAAHVSTMPRADLDAMTKSQLIEQFGA